MGYQPFSLGAIVEFCRKGVWQPAKVVGVNFDPNRKPGMGRVSYDVQVHAMFMPIRVAAKNVRGVAGPLTVDQAKVAASVAVPR